MCIAFAWVTTESSTRSSTTYSSFTSCASGTDARSTADTQTSKAQGNSAAESYFATLKNEMYYRKAFATQDRARLAVAEYIEVFYNRKRMQSSIGYRTPAQALHDYHSAAAAA